MDFLTNKHLFIALTQKAKQIKNLPLSGLLNDFDGLDIDEDGILIKTSQYYSGCGTEYESINISWEEIDKPLEYFTDLFQKEDDRKEREEEEKAAKALEDTRQREILRLKQLKEKYPDL
jgi:hypothetical protein